MTDEERQKILGETLHAAWRKGTGARYATTIYKLIADMRPGEWEAYLEWVAETLEAAGFMPPADEQAQAQAPAPVPVPVPRLAADEIPRPSARNPQVIMDAAVTIANAQLANGMELRAAVQRAHDAGASWNAIAHAIGISHSTLMRQIVAGGPIVLLKAQGRQGKAWKGRQQAGQGAERT